LAVIVPALAEFPPAVSVRLHQALLDHRPDRYLLPAGVISFFSAVLILIVAPQPASSLIFYLAGQAGTAGVVITSVMFNRRTNQRIRDWSPEAVPEEYPGMRARWDRIHFLRTLSGLW